ncbi:4'-phosphopantetheinyl transferase superfamily protein [Comamonas sp. GB3 AK4-5]|uniref:4'-phosphopantetheinyl transferase family protein n=1 Tax=Comamonas sp. GB3 AK4-5 TaxID=3231487 RepID=UPI00351E87E1
MYVSWAHSKGIVAAIASEAEVGIDIECAKSIQIDESLAQAFLSTREVNRWMRYKKWVGVDAGKNFAIQQWVRKEACVKLGAFGIEQFPAITCLPRLRPCGRQAGRRMEVDLGAHSAYLTDFCIDELGVLGSVANWT